MSSPDEELRALFGDIWNPAEAAHFAWRFLDAKLADGSKLIIMQIDTPNARLGLPLSQDSARLMIRQLEEKVTGLVLPPP